MPPPHIIPCDGSTSMILSQGLGWRELKCFLIRRSRFLTVTYWYIEKIGGPSVLWTKTETLLLESELSSFMERGNQFSFDVTAFRNRECANRSEIEVHDRAICICILSIFEIPDVYAILNHRLVLEAIDSSGASFPCFTLSRHCDRAIKKYVNRLIWKTNREVLLTLKRVHGEDSDEVRSYKEKVWSRVFRTITDVTSVLVSYWEQYHFPARLGSVADDSCNLLLTEAIYIRRNITVNPTDGYY